MYYKICIAILYALNDYMKLTPKQSLGKIRDLRNEVKAVNGTFITLFHKQNYSLA